MGKTNLTVNRLLERKDIFADFINGTLFCGEQMLKGDDLTLLSGYSGILAERNPKEEKNPDRHPPQHKPEQTTMKMVQTRAEQGDANQNILAQGKVGQANTEQSSLEQDKARQANAEQSNLEQDKAGQASAEQSNLEQDKAGQANAEQNEAKQGKTKQDKKDQDSISGKLGALERCGDIRMEAGFSTYSVILAHETQQHVHYAMPVRSMVYEALEYAQQVHALEKRHLENGDSLRGDEFLSGLTREDRLKPVISVVLYLGDDWDGCKSLYEMLEIDESDPHARLLKPYLPQQRLNLIEAGRMEHPEYFQTCLQHIFAMLNYRQDKTKLYEYIQRNRDALERMDHVEITAAFILLGEQKRVEELFRSKAESEEIGMCKAIDDLIHDGEIRGETRGLELGRAEGLQQGRQEGRQEGILEGMQSGMRKGIQQGEKRLADLLNALIQDGKQHLLSGIAVDEKLRAELYLKYQL